MNRKRVVHFCSPMVACALLAASVSLLAEPIPVKHPQATMHGFLELTTLEGKTLAMGEIVQIVRGEQLEAKVSFHFKDGSVDEETTVFTESPDFRLINDHHIQKGPSFPKPLDQDVNALTGDVVTRSMDKGKEKVETDHLDIPPDVSNGLILAMLLNLSPKTPMTKVSMVAGAPKPRIVTLAISPEGEDVFALGFQVRKAIRYDIKIEIGGVEGVVAPLIGKVPKDVRVWVAEGEEPAILKEEGQKYEGGPIWRIKLVAPSFPQDRPAVAKR